MTSLRTRVFVTVAIVLVASTALSSILSRRATLVEERQFVGPKHVAPVDAAAAIQPVLATQGWPAVAEALAALQSRTGARFIVVDDGDRILAGSSRELAAARVRSLPADGALAIEERHGDTVANVQIRGVEPQPLRDAQGLVVGRVYQLPGADEGGPRLTLGPAPWVFSTLLTAGVALLVTFLLSSHVLRPVHELTLATRRMRQGDLAVRVRPRGDDEIARLARAFNEMADRLAERERLERQMISDVAHELRSPVTNLRCTLEAMQDGLVPMERARVDALHQETLLLQRLIADLQDLALADAGGLTLHLARVDVGHVIRRAVAAEGGGATVAVHVPAEGVLLDADADRLEQVIRNLLSNARRHTPADGHIDVSVQSHDAQVRIAVADDGTGIAPEHLPHVFERFYRADASRDRATGGAGLGLAIVKRLIEAHRGTIQAHSQGTGHGATFTIDLPV